MRILFVLLMGLLFSSCAKMTVTDKSELDACVGMHWKELEEKYGEGQRHETWVTYPEFYFDENKELYYDIKFEFNEDGKVTEWSEFGLFGGSDDNGWRWIKYIYDNWWIFLLIVFALAGAWGWFTGRFNHYED